MNLMKAWLLVVALSLAAHARVTVTVSPTPFTMGVGSNLRFTATVTGTTNQAVNWSVNDASVGTIDSSGLYIAAVTLPSVGVVITATSQQDLTASGSASVTLATTDPVGKVLSNSVITCPKSRLTGVCYSLDVSCPGIADQTAYLKEVLPTGTAIGTVLFLGGGGGATLYENAFTYGSTAINTALGGQYRVVELSFDAPFITTNPDGWLTGPGGPRRTACRLATASHWVYDNLQADNSKPFCATANSGGAQGLGHIMAHYGVASIYSLVEPTSGPPFARQDYACECTQPRVFNSCTGTNTGECGGTKNATSFIDPSYASTICSTAVISHSTVDGPEFFSDSVPTPDGTYSYPTTYVRFLTGGQDKSSAEVQLSSWQTIITSGSSVACIADAPHPLPNVLDGAQQVGNDILTYCKIQKP